MIRVVIRHANSEDGLVIGDFPPSEIPELRTLLANHDVYLDSDGDREPIDITAEPTMVFAPGFHSPGRLVLEIIVG